MVAKGKESSLDDGVLDPAYELVEERGEEYFLETLEVRRPGDEKVLKISKKEKVKILETGENYKIIKRDGKIPIYYLAIPTLTKKDKQILNDVKRRAISEISLDPQSIPDLARRRVAFLKEVSVLIQANYPDLGVEKWKIFSEFIVRDMIGLGLLEPLLDDDNLEEIMVVGVRKVIYVYHRNFGMCSTNVVFDDEDEIINIINRIAQSIERRIDISSPVLDARLPDGSRVNATIPPISPHGPTITIRKFRKDPITPVDLIKFNTLTPEAAAYLWLVVDGMGVKPGNVLAAGGASSGKTTTLNCLASFIPSYQRVITIEDTLELQLPVEHWVRLETRGRNVEGKGEITMDDLLKNTLRMRPDRIIVGEVRGAEAETLFTAMNTGHDGCLGTVHANSASETISRLTNPPMNVPPIMLSALDVIVIQERTHSKGKAMRRVSEIAEIAGIRDGEVQMNIVFKYDPNADKIMKIGTSLIAAKLGQLSGKKMEEIDEELRRREEVLTWMEKNEIRDLERIASVFDSYYTDHASLMEKVMAKSLR